MGADRRAGGEIRRILVVKLSSFGDIVLSTGALEAIKRAHLLIVPSRMEGGANVVVEACRSGTPVLASRASGNVGLLGDDYCGYFDVGDAGGLARAVRRAVDDPAWLESLRRSCVQRARRMTPAAEAASLERAIRAAIREAKARMRDSTRSGATRTRKRR